MAKGFKTGGRQKGTPNFISRQVKEKLQETLNGEIDNLPEMLSELDTRDRLHVVIKLMPYVMPKLQNVEMTEPQMQEETDLSEVPTDILEKLIELQEKAAPYIKTVYRTKEGKRLPDWLQEDV